MSLVGLCQNLIALSGSVCYILVSGTTLMKRTLAILFILFCSLSVIYAQEETNINTDQPFAPQEAVKTKGADNYYADPFSDLAELENRDEEEEEEAIDRFYAYGRIFHISVYGNTAYMLGQMSNIYQSGWFIGGRVSYFLDWDLAITFHVSIGKTSMSFANPDPTDNHLIPTFTGSAVLFNLGLGLKYYLNFNDISKAIAYINPAIHFGAEISIINDSLNMEDIPPSININDPSHKMVGPGLFFGISLEVPIFRKSVYLGGEFLYHLSFFPADNNKIPYNDTHFSNLNYSGRYMTLGGNITINL